MRKGVLTAACVFVAAGTALAGLGSVMGSFEIPGVEGRRYCGGLAADKDVVWSLNNYEAYIYMCDSLTGHRHTYFPTSGGIYASGLAYQSGGYLWQNQGMLPVYYIYRKNCGNGSVYNYYNLPYVRYTTGTAPLATGDGGVGTSYIILSNYDTRTIYYMTTMGTFTRSHTVAHPMFDIAYDWRNRLIWGGWNSGTCYGYNTNGSFVANFNIPTGNIYGVTYYGEYLWVAGHTGYVYRIHCPGNLGVRPSSLGRIKAIHR